MPEYFPENNTPIWSDTEVRSLQKIVGAIESLPAASVNTSDVLASIDWEEVTR